MALIFPRYLLNRWSAPLAGSAVFFGGLVMANEVVALSRDIFNHGASFRWLFPLLATAVPEILGMILPMAAVLGGLLGTQHLASGSELVACQGLGAGRRILLRPFLILGIALASLAALNAHWIVPRVARIQTTIRGRMLEEARTRFLRPGAPPWVPPRSPGTSLWVAPGGQLHLMEVTEHSVQHLVARQIAWNIDDSDQDSTRLSIHLQDLQGALHSRPENRIVQIHQQSQHLEYRIPPSARLFPPLPTRYLGDAQLLASPEPQARVELARRFALPLASMGLLLLGIALGMGHPRFQRSGALLKSLGVILLYYVLMKVLENQVIYGKQTDVWPLYLLPLAALGAGLLLLDRKLRPHRTRHPGSRLWHSLRNLLGFLPVAFVNRRIALVRLVLRRLRRKQHRERGEGVLSTWSRSLWWASWGGALGTMLALSFLVEYANLAGEISKYNVPFHRFLLYWFWNLPPFLGVALPVAFLLGGVLVFSEAAASREWVALRAGGVSLVRWIRAGWKGWGTVALLGALLPVLLAPAAHARADRLYREILNRPVRSASTTPWLHVGSTGVLWFLEGRTRWGFPLHAPGVAPVLLRWELGADRSEALPWGGLRFVEGPEGSRLFPEASLQRTASAEESGTFDLVQWQRWAPHPERAALLWNRLLGWLAGPALLFAALSFAFPPPRGGRGQALGAALILALAFLGLQSLFGGAARAGEIPALWGVIGPLCFLVGFGLLRLRWVKT